MTRSVLYPLLGFAIFCGSASAVIHVPGDYPTISEAIDVATPGETIVVQPGTYAGEAMNITFDLEIIAHGGATIDAQSSSRGVAFQGVSSACVFSGFTIENGLFETGGGIVCIDASPTIHSCIVRNNTATIKGGGIYVLSGSPDLFNNTVTGNTAPSGAGLHVEGGGPERIRIRNNVITGNTATDDGGGVYIGGAPALLTGNNIGGNEARRGGGVMISNGGGESVALAFNSILNNTAYQGGGIFAQGGSDTLHHNYIVANRAIATAEWGDDARGGGLYIYEYLITARLEGNIWSNNTSDVFGGAISSYVGPELSLVSEVITGNHADALAGGIHAYFTTMSITGSSITGNTAWSSPQIYSFGNPSVAAAAVGVQYSNVEGGWPGLGNIDVDPRFRNPAGDDFHLMSTACGDPFDSPLIDAGDPGRFDELLDCDHGLGTNRSDIGAYGGSNLDIPTGLEDDGASAGIRPEVVTLAQNRPNPFNPSTRIDFTVAAAGYVQVEVFDLLGRRVVTLAEGIYPAGRHTIAWDGRRFDGRTVPTGVYFYRVAAGGDSRVRRMLLLK